MRSLQIRRIIRKQWREQKFKFVFSLSEFSSIEAKDLVVNKAARYGCYIASDTGSLYLIPLKVCNVRARTVTVSGACLALTNILNKVYSERSCLTCVLNNIAPSLLRYSKQICLLNGTNLKDFIQVLI